MAGTAALFVVGSFVVACSAKVARLPRPGESLIASSFTVEPGGKGFNVAAAARRLGVEVDGVFAVGADLFAEVARRAFAAEGLPADAIVRLAGQTGAGIGFTDAAGENSLAVNPGANGLLAATDVEARRDRIAKAALTTAQFEVSDPPIIAAFRVARASGRMTLLNPSPYRPVPAELLERCAIVVVNEVEAGLLAADLAVAAPSGDGDMLATWSGLGHAVHRRGVEILVVTLGGRGALAYPVGGRPLHQPAIPVEVVDTLGAGDAFLAGLASALVSGEPLDVGLRRAAACGALCVAGLGVLGTLPRRSEVEALLEGFRIPA